MEAASLDKQEGSLTVKLIAGVALFALVLIFFLGRPTRHQVAWAAGGMQGSFSIALSMFQYANDHNGAYPDGKSSTEVFQKLIDGKYVPDSQIFFIPLAGKIKPVMGERLKPENVSFDVTSGVNANDPDGLPLVFLTGYKVYYSPDGSAVSIVTGNPPYSAEPFTWAGWWDHPEFFPPSLGVTYKNNNYSSKRLKFPAGAKPFVPHFVPPNFDPHGKIYRQLTPDGLLAP